jgi:hypothetical protein
MKPMLALSLLIAIPTATDKPKPLKTEELIQLRATVKELEELVAEHEERLSVHKAEMDSMRRLVGTLESRMAAAEAKDSSHAAAQLKH